MTKKLLTLLLFAVPLFSIAQEKGLDERINDWFEPITAKWEGIVFWVVPGTGVPLVVFLLVIEFKGNTENGQMLSVPNTKKYIPIIITKSNLKVDEKGSYWQITASASAGQALKDSYTKLKNEVSLVGKTVQELLQRFFYL